MDYAQQCCALGKAARPGAAISAGGGHRFLSEYGVGVPGADLPAPAGVPDPDRGAGAGVRAVVRGGAGPARIRASLADLARSNMLPVPSWSDARHFSGGVSSCGPRRCHGIRSVLTTSAVSAGDPVLAAKITAPGVPGWAVSRPRITELIGQGIRSCRLTVVTGSPGAGKTTALALWAAAEPGVVAWVGLDGYDNRPGVFSLTDLTGGPCPGRCGEPSSCRM